MTSLSWTENRASTCLVTPDYSHGYALIGNGLASRLSPVPGARPPSSNEARTVLILGASKTILWMLSSIWAPSAYPGGAAIRASGDASRTLRRWSVWARSPGSVVDHTRLAPALRCGLRRRRCVILLLINVAFGRDA